MALNRLLTQEGKLMQLRALGYSQEEIAQQLGITQSAVSQRLSNIRNLAEQKQSDDKAFWELLLGMGAVYLLGKILEEVE